MQTILSLRPSSQARRREPRHRQRACVAVRRARLRPDDRPDAPPRRSTPGRPDRDAGPASTPSPTPSTSPSGGPVRRPPRRPCRCRPTETMVVRAYFVLGGEPASPGWCRSCGVVPKTTGVARAAMKALLAGSTRSEAGGRTITSAIPAGTKLLGISIKNGVATVDLSREFDSGGGSDIDPYRLGQVVYTLTQFSTVKSVMFQIEGQTVTVFGREGIVLEGPVGREDFLDQLPSMFVDRPAYGAALGNPAAVTGNADVFEATFRIALLDASGKTLVDQQVMATCGAGVPRARSTRRCSTPSRRRSGGRSASTTARRRTGRPRISATTRSGSRLPSDRPDLIRLHAGGLGPDLVALAARSGPLLSSAGSVKRAPSVGAWRSLVARIVRDDEVGGSNPLAPTKLTCSRARSLVAAWRPVRCGSHPG